MKRHEDLKAELLRNPAVRQEYERLGPEFDMIHARLEGGRTTPTWKTLSRYAEATGCRLRVSLEAS